MAHLVKVNVEGGKLNRKETLLIVSAAVMETLINPPFYHITQRFSFSINIFCIVSNFPSARLVKMSTSNLFYVSFLFFGTASSRFRIELSFATVLDPVPFSSSNSLSIKNNRSFRYN